MAYMMYVCPNCRKVFKINGSGKKAKCPKCQDEILSDTGIAEDVWKTYDAAQKDSIISEILDESEIIEVEEVIPEVSKPQRSSSFFDADLPMSPDQNYSDYNAAPQRNYQEDYSTSYYTPSTPQAAPSAKSGGNQKRKDSKLSIIAAILSIFGCTAIIGVIIAIIDLTRNKNDGNRHLGSWFCIIITSVYVLGYAILNPGKKSDKEKPVAENKKTESVTESAPVVTPIEDTDQVVETAKETETGNAKGAEALASQYGVTLAPSSKDMKVGDIGEKSGVFVGLSYVKAMSYLPTGLSKEDISSNNEVILGFFDFLNATGEKTTISPEDITCYADGTQVEDVDTYIKVVCDDVNQFYYAGVDADMKLLSVQDFEVPKGWKELKFFYKSDCVWTVTPDEVGTEPFSKGSMYSYTYEHDVTPENTVVHSEDFELTYRGFGEHTYDNVITGPQKYAVFEFTINNTTDSQIDYNLAGYKMRGYRNGYLLPDSDFILDDKIDGFSNIYNIDTIESGMSSDIYVAFEVPDFKGDYCCIYDDGFIIGKDKGAVYIKR